MVGERPLWGIESHEESQTDGHTMRSCCRSPKVNGPVQGATWWVRDRDMDRHTMQGEVGYLFSRLGRGKGRREKSREREKQKGRRVDVGRMERGRNCLFWGEMEKGRDPG